MPSASYLPMGIGVSFWWWDALPHKPAINKFQICIFSDLYKRELWAASRLGQQALESEELSSLLEELRKKLEILKIHGDKMAADMRQMQVNYFIFKF